MLARNKAGEAEVRKAVERLAESLRQKDVNKALSAYAPDNVQFLLAPPLQYAGANKIDAKSLKEWFDTFEGPIGFEIGELSVTADDDLAFAHGLNRMSGKKKSGEKADLWVRETLCFRKIDGEWKVTHQHELVPFHMDGSMKAATDLHP